MYSGSCPAYCTKKIGRSCPRYTSEAITPISASSWCQPTGSRSSHSTRSPTAATSTTASSQACAGPAHSRRPNEDTIDILSAARGGLEAPDAPVGLYGHARTRTSTPNPRPPEAALRELPCRPPDLEALRPAFYTRTDPASGADGLTWLQAMAPETDEIRALLDLCPDGYESLSAVYRAAWSFVDPIILELCRLRLAQLLGCHTDLRVRYEPAVAAGLRQEKLARLERWPSAPDFSA